MWKHKTIVFINIPSVLYGCEVRTTIAASSLSAVLTSMAANEAKILSTRLLFIFKPALVEPHKLWNYLRRWLNDFISQRNLLIMSEYLLRLFFLYVAGVFTVLTGVGSWFHRWGTKINKLVIWIWRSKTRGR